MTIQSCSDADVQFVHESFIAIFKDVAYSTRASAYTEICTLLGHGHCIRPPWNSIQYSPYCVYKLERKRTIRKKLADFNLNMMHFKEHFKKKTLCAELSKFSSDLVCDRVHKFRAFPNEADSPAPADQTRLDAHYTTRILVVRQKSFHRRHHEVARPTAPASAPLPKKADSPIPVDQIHPDVHYTMQILVVQHQSLRWHEASRFQTPALPSSQPCLPFWLPKLSKLTLKLPTEWGEKTQKNRKSNLKNSPKSFLQFDLCNTPKRNRKHHDTE